MTCGRQTNPHEVTVPLYRVPVGEGFRILGSRGTVVEQLTDGTVRVHTRVAGTDEWNQSRWLGTMNVKREVKA